MFFKGTKKRHGNRNRERCGVLWWAMHSLHLTFTCYYINCPGSQTTKSVDILCDMVCSPLFNKNDIPAEREVVLEEFKEASIAPVSLILLTFKKNSSQTVMYVKFLAVGKQFQPLPENSY